MTTATAPASSPVADHQADLRRKRAERLRLAVAWIERHDAWEQVRTIDARYSPPRLDVGSLASMAALATGITATGRHSANAVHWLVSVDGVDLTCCELTKVSTEEVEVQL